MLCEMQAEALLLPFSRWVQAIIQLTLGGGIGSCFKKYSYCGSEFFMWSADCRGQAGLMEL